jgi:eukaryotic-like serine/threonine-protein kinase
MELWTEYEGRTIDNVFPLTKLLRPQGRSAFFLTSNGSGVSRVIRLIEPHFDEDEIVARWRAVAALNHPNLLKLEKFGQVTLDGAPLIYGVMEPVDANLADVLVNQRLTLPDARQLAASLNSALEVLHSNEFIHEHVDPANVYAVGEIVKLRSDCIRECPEGREGQELKKRDLHDLAVVLLQSLTQQRTLEDAAREFPLPMPFDSIVRKTIRGEWGAREISAALETPATPRPTSPENTAVAADAIPTSDSPASKPQVANVPPAERIRPSLPDVKPEQQPRFKLGPKSIGIAVAILLALWLGWHFLSSRPANPASTQPASVSQVQAANDLPASVPATPSAPAARSATPSPQPPDVRNQWRVIAYTYNYQDQAQHKAAVVARARPDLRPEVFTPTGHAPYLVSLGGPMSRDEAFALAQRARNEGLPRDVYAQNYSGRSR